MKVTLHSLELKIPYQLFKRVKIAAAAMNITNSRFIREAIHEQLIAVDFKINMSFFRALEREKKISPKTGRSYHIVRVRVSTQFRTLMKIYAAERDITTIQLVNYALNEKLNREGY